MDKRKSWAKQMRNTYNIDDWKKVHFSDEVHFERGAQRKLHIIRKPGERTCQDCIQEQDEPEEKDKETETLLLLGRRGIQLQVGAYFL